MKTRIKRIMAILLVFACFFSFSACRETQKGQSLGIPYESLDSVARVPWDLVIHEGMLYVGAGDYGRNISPTVAMRLSLDTYAWESCGEIADEQINRFLMLGDQLIIPGTDPVEGWTVGSYYVLGEEGFSPIKSIPGGIHLFDMIEYDGKLFAALGTDDEHMPMAISQDGGVTFTAVPMMKDGSYVLFDGMNRVYDLFTLDASLYCLYGKHLFRYEEENGTCRFEHIADWTKAYQLAEETYVPILAKAEIGGSLYFTTEYFYRCDSENGTVSSPVRIKLKNCDAVTDLFTHDGKLYLLAYEKRGSRYEVSVRESEDGETFRELFYFTYPIPAMSFAFDGESFYLGMGKINGENEKNGEILKITPS